MTNTVSASVPAKGYAALSATTPLQPFSFERRLPGPREVLIDIAFCGVCHSDIHQARDEWGGSMFPMVPGHEIVGTVKAVGNQVTRFQVGDLAGVGCMVDSCKACASCNDGFEQYCDRGFTGTYNAFERGSKTLTQGGYADKITVREDFVLKISPRLDLKAVAPLLCAGVTTYSPLKHWKVGPGQTVGIVGLGGLGHMAVKFAKEFGAKVVVFTTSESKQKDALRLGADEVVVTTQRGAFDRYRGRMNFILNTVAANIDFDPYLGCLKRDGTFVIVGIPEDPLKVEAFSLIGGRRSIAGSLIGGIKETQEMLDYCAEKKIVSDVELIPIQQINTAFERVIKSQVKYRFVIDMKSLKS